MGTSLSFKTKKSPTIRPIKTTSQPPDAQLINWTQTKMYHKIFMFSFLCRQEARCEVRRHDSGQQLGQGQARLQDQGLL